MEKIDIKKIIDKVILICSNNPEVYSNIIKDFYTKGIDKSSPYLESLGIPRLKEKELQNRFKENKKKIIDYIKNQIKPSLDIYNILSCIYGSFMGDGIGAFCEFHKSNPKNYKKIFRDKPVFGQLSGQITDDSEMAMSFGYAMMDNPEKEAISPDYLYFYYGAWAKSKPIDIGKTTHKSFTKFDFNYFHPKKGNFKNVKNEIYTNNIKSLSNGFLMRKSTFIAWIYYRFFPLINAAFNNIDDNTFLLELYKKIKNLSEIDNQCTHPNPENNAVSAFYCIMALGAIRELRANNIIDKILYLCKDEYFKKKGEEDLIVANFIISYIEKFKSLEFKFDSFSDTKSNDCIIKHMGWYGHSLKLTLYYLINFEFIEEGKDNNRFQTIMEQICNLGGDTDTNCCIVGSVIGPLVGLNKFGKYFDKIIDVIPKNRYLFSICLMLPYVLYLKNSNRNNELIKDEHYFLRTILTMLYDDIEIDYYNPRI
jgi:ADP-ribosylglycohydrolase